MANHLHGSVTGEMAVDFLSSTWVLKEGHKNKKLIKKKTIKNVTKM